MHKFSLPKAKMNLPKSIIMNVTSGSKIEIPQIVYPITRSDEKHIADIRTPNLSTRCPPKKGIIILGPE